VKRPNDGIDLRLSAIPKLPPFGLDLVAAAGSAFSAAGLAAAPANTILLDDGDECSRQKPIQVIDASRTGRNCNDEFVQDLASFGTSTTGNDR
jgi:hypothetical protein